MQITFRPGYLKHLVLFLLCTTDLLGQNRIADSLFNLLRQSKHDTTKINALNGLSWELRNNKPDTSLILSGEALKMSNKLGYEKGIGKAYHNLAFISYTKGNFDSAIVLNDKAILIWKKNLQKNPASLSVLQSLGYTTGNLGNVYKDKGEYPKALELYFESLKIAQKLSALPDKALSKSGKMSEASLLSNIGLIYFAQGSVLVDSVEKTLLLNKALDNYLKALKVDEEMGNKRGMSIRYGNIGNIYYTLNDFSKTLHYCFLSLHLAEEINNPQLITTALGNIGNAFRKQGDSAGIKGNTEYMLKKHQQASEYYFNTIKLAEKTGNTPVMANNLGSLGILLMQNPSLKPPAGEKKNGYALAEDYIKQSLDIYYASGALDFVQHMETNLSLLYSKMGKYEKSLEHYKKYIKIRDSVFNEENSKRSLRAEMDFEYEKKEALAKAEHEKKEALAEAENKRQRIIIFTAITGLLLVMVFSVVLFNRFRLTQKQKLIIEEQKITVEEKNKEITDSINYAKRIQDAIVPPEDFVKKHLPESFIFYKPKDIVAGDFYWMELVAQPAASSAGLKMNDARSASGAVARQADSGPEQILIAAADCTGHGVPGAMVSVVCCNALNRTVKEFGYTDPGKILDKTRELVLDTFSRSNSSVRDGMDISLLSIQKSGNNYSIKWSGANNPIWYVQQGELREIKADKQPIGKTEDPKPFTTHELTLDSGDMLYLFSDGLPDQFGGPKGKKFKYSQFQDLIRQYHSREVTEQKFLFTEAIEKWRGQLEQVDDMLVIGIRL